MWAIESLASFVARTRPEILPQSARDMAKNCILDLVGAARAGFETPTARAVRGTTLSLFAEGQSSVWFSRERRQAAGAAFINSSAGSALDIDDGHRGASGHPGAAIVPAVLAVAEETGASGADVLAAVVLGYEVSVRVGATKDYSFPGWLATGRWSPYGVAAAAGWLRGLAPDKLAHAIAVAAAQAPVLYPFAPVNGNSVKEGIPFSTMAGLMAVELAERGFTGPTHLLDYQGDFDGGRILGSLGRDWAIEGSYFKPYACCRWIHAAVNAFTALRAEHGIQAEEVQRILVSTFEKSRRMNNSPNPTKLEQAQFSFPWVLALVAIDGEQSLMPMSSADFGRTELVAFAERVRVEVDPALDAAFPRQVPGRVRIETARGTFERQVDHPLGDPDNPMSTQLLSDKLRRITSQDWPAEAQERVIEAILTLDQAPSVRHLSEALASTERAVAARD